jgi:ubiquinone/menaquinone biosynthesis C-methylase UbiE
MSAVFAQDHEHEHEAVEKRIPAKYMSYRGAPWLERKTRIQEEEPFKVIEAMKLEKGQTVVDLGVGSGFFARKIARVVGDKGVVYGVDIQREMLDILSKLCEDEGVNNVKPVLGTVTSTTLPDECADWIILADVYHEFSEHEAMLADMMRILKPGGKVALLEYRLEDDSGAHIKTDHRMSVKQVKAEWLPAGFKLVEILEFLKSQHLFIFQKEVEKK